MRRGFDSRHYIALDQGMPEHPKVISLSDTAFRVYVELICYSARVQSDGALNIGIVRRYPTAVITELCEARLLDQLADGWGIHDYLRHQRSAAEIAAIVEGRRLGGTLGNHARWHVALRRTDPDCPHCDHITAGQSPNRSLNHRPPIA